MHIFYYWISNMFSKKYDFIEEFKGLSLFFKLYKSINKKIK